MHGARERHTLRWDAQRALLDEEIARLERELEQANAQSPRAVELRQLRDDALRRRAALGPSPHPKMG